MEPVSPTRITTGVPGLDHILCGGLPTEELYLVQGGPGTGKTTLALQFLRSGADAGRSALYITLSQSRLSLEKIARSHGWRLDGIQVHELGRNEPEPQSVFPSVEVELKELLATFYEAIDEAQPQCLVLDTILDLRTLANDAMRYRQELLNLRLRLHAVGCTSLFLDDAPANGGDKELRGQAHGIITLEQEAPDYGEVKRRLQVPKLRGSTFHGGYHNFRIQTGGLEVFPRVKANGKKRSATWDVVPSGLPALDDMLGGGLREGTACLVAGPTGSGKTSVSFQYAYAAVERGEAAAVFLFNERLETFLLRSHALGMDVQHHVEAGLLHVHQINTGTTTPSEFAQHVRRSVEEDEARVIVIDSLSGYINAMLHRHLLVSQMHELITFLSQRGVLTFLIVDQHGAFSSDELASPAHVSYLADSVLLLRFSHEDDVPIRTISVLKQRHGPHELAARYLNFSSEGIQVGEQLAGVLHRSLDPPLFATFYSPTTSSYEDELAPPARDGA